MQKVIFCIEKAKIEDNNNVNINNYSTTKNKFAIFKLKKTPKKSRWTKQEDEILLRLSQRMKRNKWKFCSLILKNKSSYQCYLRFKKINPNILKGRWSEAEDKQLLKLVGIFGKSWKSIAKIMKTRTNKQIRNRYEEHLSEHLNKGIFSKEEDEKLKMLYNGLEGNWFKYKEYFPDRPIKKLKNRIHFLINRQKIIKKKNYSCSNNNNITTDLTRLISINPSNAGSSLYFQRNSSSNHNNFSNNYCSNVNLISNNNEYNIPSEISIKENISTTISIDVLQKRCYFNKNFFMQGKNHFIFVILKQIKKQEILLFFFIYFNQKNANLKNSYRNILRSFS